MSPRSLWTIILKIFGIYIFLQVLYAVPQIISMGLFSAGQDGVSILRIIAGVIFSISLYLFMVIAFVFRTDWLIGVLRLDKGITEETLEFNMHRSTILTLAVIITGLILLVESLPQLLKDVYTYVRDINDYNGLKRYPETGYIIFNTVKVFVSYFMVTSSRLIVNFVERKRKGKVKMENPGLPENN